MTDHDEADRAVAEAKHLIASGDYWSALDRLRTAVETLPAGRADATVMQIREAANDLARGAPRFASAVQAIRDSIAGRVGVPSPRATLAREEPWLYSAAEILSDVAWIAAAICLLAGIVGVVEGVRHHLGGNVIWLLIGTGFTVALWASIAVGLALLVDIGRTTGASHSGL